MSTDRKDARKLRLVGDGPDDEDQGNSEVTCAACGWPYWGMGYPGIGDCHVNDYPGGHNPRVSGLKLSVARRHEFVPVDDLAATGDNQFTMSVAGVTYVVYNHDAAGIIGLWNTSREAHWFAPSRILKIRLRWPSTSREAPPPFVFATGAPSRWVQMDLDARSEWSKFSISHQPIEPCQILECTHPDGPIDTPEPTGSTEDDAPLPSRSLPDRSAAQHSDQSSVPNVLAFIDPFKSRSDQVSEFSIEVSEYSPDDDYNEIHLTGTTERKVRDALIRHLDAIEPAASIVLSSSFDLTDDPALAAWAARREPLADGPALWQLGEHWIGEPDIELRELWDGDSWTVRADPAVGKLVGQVVVINDVGYFPLERVDAAQPVLWTPGGDIDVVLLRERCSTAFGSTTRRFAVRTDGLIETSLWYNEGPPPQYVLLPAADDDTALIEQLVEFNRTWTHCCNDSDPVDHTFPALFDNYLRTLDEQQSSWSDQGNHPDFDANYSLSPSQREVAIRLRTGIAGPSSGS